MLGLFGKKKETGESSVAPVGPPVDIKWARNRKGNFHNLMFLDTVSEGLDGRSGVFAIWKGGVKPEWLYTGSTEDLAATLDQLIDDSELEEYYAQSGAFVSWAMVKPEYQDGIVRYLNEAMKPEVDNHQIHRLKRKKVPMIAVLLPGREGK